MPLLRGSDGAAGGDAQAPLGRRSATSSALTWPFFLFVALYATPIVHVLFGDQWLPAADLLRLIALGGPFWLVGCLVPPLLTALGQVGLILRVQVWRSWWRWSASASRRRTGVGAVAVAAIPISACACADLAMGVAQHFALCTQTSLDRVVPSAIVTLAAITLPAILRALAVNLPATAELALALPCACVLAG